MTHSFHWPLAVTRKILSNIRHFIHVRTLNQNFTVLYICAKNNWAYTSPELHYVLIWSLTSRVLLYLRAQMWLFYLATNYNEALQITLSHTSTYKYTLQITCHTWESSLFHHKWPHKNITFNPKPPYFNKIWRACRPYRNDQKHQILALYPL
jgi:hypothetical protein